MNGFNRPEQKSLTEIPSDSKKLQALSSNHKEVLSLLAQGLPQAEVAAITGFAPGYIPWLVKQEVCQQYLADMRAVVDHRFTAMTEQSCDTILDVMKNGATDERLKAAKLQLEVVGMVGAGKKDIQPQGNNDHLQQLADRLVGLLKSTREGIVYENEISDAELLPCAEVQPTQNSNQASRSEAA